jgi:probable phosphomutase (TIGR03848 family)
MPAAAPTVVLLVRHGRTPTTGIVVPGRSPGLALDAEGRRQAEHAARRIGRLGRVAAVYASPLLRTRQTAAPIARACGCPVDVGDWTGLRLARLRRRREWPEVQQRPSRFRFPGGESFAEVQLRMVNAIEDFVARHRGGLVVAVSHADPIKAALAHALGLPLDLFQRLTVAPGSVSAVAYASAPRLLTINSLDGDLAGSVAR